MKCTAVCLLAIGLSLQQCGQQNQTIQTATAQDTGYYSAADFFKVKKFDAHVHLFTNNTGFDTLASADNFSLLTITLDDANEPPPMEEQQQLALGHVRAFPGNIDYATTISVRNFKKKGWEQETINYLKNSFDSGAVAVKIYKVIGMSLRDSSGKLVMIDDPRFDPIFDFIKQHNISVLGHLGEPKNCWLPVDKMTIKGDQSYYTEFPIYHMYLHPEFPSYEQQVAARDHMLERHPDLRFVGAHLGSLEWSVDELAKRLDKYPNMAVDMAARITHLQYQSVNNWQKVHDFMIKYQDRLLYATDDVLTDKYEFSRIKEKLHETWTHDWQFFTSQDSMVSKDFEGRFKGLQLPKKVIDKIYRENAEHWYPGIKKKA